MHMLSRSLHSLLHSHALVPRLHIWPCEAAQGVHSKHMQVVSELLALDPQEPLWLCSPVLSGTV